jgi:hypothetical protein
VLSVLKIYKGNGHDFTFLTISQLSDDLKQCEFGFKFVINAAIRTIALLVFRVSE